MFVYHTCHIIAVTNIITDDLLSVHLPLHVYVTSVIRGLFEVLCSKLQRRVPLLLDLAQKPRWQSSIYQSLAVSSQTAEKFSASLSSNNTTFRLLSELRLHSHIHKYLLKKGTITKYFLYFFEGHVYILRSDI